MSGTNAEIQNGPKLESKTGIRIEKWLGLIAINYLNILFYVKINEKLDELSRMKGLDDNFFERLEFALSARIVKAESGKIIRPVQQFGLKIDYEEELQTTLEATQKYGFEFNLERLKKLRMICQSASINKTIEPQDLDTLRQFLTCLDRYSYFVVPAVESPELAKSG